MKTKLLFLALCSAALPSAYASPKIASGKKLVRHVMDGVDAQELFSHLSLPVNENGVKTLLAAEDGVALSCAASVEGSLCVVDMETEDGTVMIRGRNAEKLWTALALTEFAGRTSNSKYFSDEDSHFGLQCSRSYIPNGNPYACALELRP